MNEKDWESELPITMNEDGSATVTLSPSLVARIFTALILPKGEAGGLVLNDVGDEDTARMLEAFEASRREHAEVYRRLLSPHL